MLKCPLTPPSEYNNLVITQYDTIKKVEIFILNILFQIATFCRSLCDYKPKFIGPLMYIMASRIDSSCVAERVAAVACLSALITRLLYTLFFRYYT